LAAQSEPPSQQPPSLLDATGGPLGMAETALPAAAFVVAYTASGSQVNLSAYVAVAIAIVLAAARLARRETPRHALSGLFGVALAAFVSTRSGRAEDFFLPGLIANAGYAAAFLVSIVIRRPIIGYVTTQLDGSQASEWRRDKLRMRAFNRATGVWAGLFLTRLAVQLPLYLAGAVVALGVARTAMGLPLFAVGLWLSYLLVRSAPGPAPARN
jgi:Protein of unknown function (DUF3159)